MPKRCAAVVSSRPACLHPQAVRSVLQRFSSPGGKLSEYWLPQKGTVSAVYGSTALVMVNVAVVVAMVVPVAVVVLVAMVVYVVMIGILPFLVAMTAAMLTVVVIMQPFLVVMHGTVPVAFVVFVAGPAITSMIVGVGVDRATVLSGSCRGTGPAQLCLLCGSLACSTVAHSQCSGLKCGLVGLRPLHRKSSEVRSKACTDHDWWTGEGCCPRPRKAVPKPHVDTVLWSQFAGQASPRADLCIL